MEFLVSEGMSEGALPFSLKIFDKKIWPVSTSGEGTLYFIYRIRLLTMMFWFVSVQNMVGKKIRLDTKKLPNIFCPFVRAPFVVPRDKSLNNIIYITYIKVHLKNLQNLDLMDHPNGVFGIRGYVWGYFPIFIKNIQ